MATNSAMKVALACGKVIERAEVTPHPWPVAGVSLLIPTIALVRRFSRGDDAGRTLSVAANRQRRNDPAVRRLPALPQFFAEAQHADETILQADPRHAK